MNGRDRAQHRQRLVQRPSLAIQLRRDRDRHRIHVGDDAQAVALMELPRLGAGYARRIVQSRKESMPDRAVFFRHHLAGLIVEAVDHHTVEAGPPAPARGDPVERPQFACCCSAAIMPQTMAPALMDESSTQGSPSITAASCMTSSATWRR